MTITSKNSRTLSGTKSKNSWVEEWAELQTEGTGNIFSEIIEENFPNLGNDMVIQVQSHLEPQVDMTRKKPYQYHLIVKGQN
jgi:hypothetical protein